MSLSNVTIYNNKLSKRNIEFQQNSTIQARFYKYLGGDNLVYKNFTIEDQNSQNYTQLYNVSGTTTTDNDFNVNANYLQHGCIFLPKFAVIMFSGAIVDIPYGWLLCNGQITPINGINVTTPDLRGRFVLAFNPDVVVASNSTGNRSIINTLNTVGGELNHTLTITEIPAHTHGSNDNPPSVGLVQRTESNTLTISDSFGGELDLVNAAALNIHYTGGAGSASDGTTNVNNATQTHNNMPPYYVLCFIMKGF